MIQVFDNRGVLMRIVVEGCGDWAMQYLDALRDFARGMGVFFTYDSTFGLDAANRRLRADVFADYLQATLRNVEKVRSAGFATLDVKDTLSRLQGSSLRGREPLPASVDTVFITTPDRTHCDVATYWLGRARRIFVEKPFDRSASRIQSFCEAATRSASEVYAVDHYFVRCNQLASHKGFFADRLLREPGEHGRIGDLEYFEFCVTEPPARDSQGTYDASALRRRALSLQGGMAFDLGAHALPLLLPFLDLRSFHPTRVWAGVSEGLSDVLFSGADSFSMAEVEASTTAAAGRRSRRVEGALLVGKDIGDRPVKYLMLQGPGGKLHFNLTEYSVSLEHPDGQIEPLAALHQNWIRFFVREVLQDRVPASVIMFRPRAGQHVVEFLEKWRNTMVRTMESTGLQRYRPGANIVELRKPVYSVL